MNLENFLNDTTEIVEQENLNEIINNINKLELQLATFKKIETTYKELKEKLYQEMLKRNIKSYTFNDNGTKITLIDEIKPTTYTKKSFSVDKLFNENPELYKTYRNIIETYVEEQEVVENGKKGYVRITKPKIEII